MSDEPGDQALPIRHEKPYKTRVDGEDWVVRQRSDEPGTYDFDWVSGPNEGYGFMSAMSDGSQLTEAQLDKSIRDFLKEIDPATGFLAD